mgnify:CR=1 FL=1
MDIKGDGKIIIMNPLNPKIAAVELLCNATLSIEVNIIDDFKLVGLTKEFDFQIKELKALFATQETLEDIQKKIMGIKPMI